MEAGLTDHVWEISEMVALGDVQPLRLLKFKLTRFLLEWQVES